MNQTQRFRLGLGMRAGEGVWAFYQWRSVPECKDGGGGVRRPGFSYRWDLTKNKVAVKETMCVVASKDIMNVVASKSRDWLRARIKAKDLAPSTQNFCTPLQSPRGKEREMENRSAVVHTMMIITIIKTPKEQS